MYFINHPFREWIQSKKYLMPDLLLIWCCCTNGIKGNNVQGKLHLWVDIFPWDRNLPPPTNILPRESQKMVLRYIYVI